MAANTTPIFVITPRIGMVRMSIANTGRDGTGTLNDVITGGTNGTRIDRIVFRATVTTTAGMVRLFIYDGTNNRFWWEGPVTAITVGSSTPAWTYTLVSPDPQSPLLVLPSTSYVLRAATNNAETFDVIAHGGDF
jgi:hypothetical protein